MKKLSNEALATLSSLEIDGTKARITSGTLDRKIYLEVNAALEVLGGKWDRKTKSHMFPNDPSEALDEIVLTGQFSHPRDEFDFFETPAALADRVIKVADIHEGHTVLEPSAGRGALAFRAAMRGAAVSCVELDPRNIAHLNAKTYGIPNNPIYAREPRPFASVLTCDFLDDGIVVGPKPRFDRVVMNPPFSGSKGLAHVEKAWTFVKPGGRLVAILPSSVKFRKSNAFDAFRALVDRNRGKIEDLPEGSFKESGTMVNTVLVTLDKSAT